MNDHRIWLRLGGVLAAAAVCTGGAAVAANRAQEAKNVQTAFLGAMETQMQIGCYPSENGSPADLPSRNVQNCRRHTRHGWSSTTPRKIPAGSDTLH